jgi:hypothetical protein
MRLVSIHGGKLAAMSKSAVVANCRKQVCFATDVVDHQLIIHDYEGLARAVAEFDDRYLASI